MRYYCNSGSRPRSHGRSSTPDTKTSLLPWGWLAIVTSGLETTFPKTLHAPAQGGFGRQRGPEGWLSGPRKRVSSALVGRATDHGWLHPRVCVSECRSFWPVGRGGGNQSWASRTVCATGAALRVSMCEVSLSGRPPSPVAASRPGYVGSAPSLPLITRTAIHAHYGPARSARLFKNELWQGVPQRPARRLV